MQKDRDGITMDLSYEFTSVINGTLILSKFDEFGQIEEVIEGYDSIKAYLKKFKKNERDNTKS